MSGPSAAWCRVSLGWWGLDLVGGGLKLGGQGQAVCSAQVRQRMHGHASWDGVPAQASCGDVPAAGPCRLT
jgi:hypothetical protein